MPIPDPIATIKNISELVKKYNDLELMKQIVSLQTEVFDLKTENLNLREQVAKLSAKEKMIRKEPHGYYFKEGEDIPHCPKCWENDGKAITLPAAKDYVTDHGRICRVCHHHYDEGPPQRRPGGGGRTGIWS